MIIELTEKEIKALIVAHLEKNNIKINDELKDIIIERRKRSDGSPGYLTATVYVNRNTK